MNQNKILQVLVPIVAIVVLVESVMLISNLKGKTTPSVIDDTKQPANVEVSKVPVASVFDISIKSDVSPMTLAKSGKFEVTMVGNSDRALDSINVYVKYDPNAFNVPELVFDKKLPKPAFSKVSETRGLLVVNFLIADAGGLKLKAGELLPLMSFQATPKKVGKFDFEISTGSELKESATMIVENATSKVLPFSSNKLTVNVTQ